MQLSETKSALVLPESRISGTWSPTSIDAVSARPLLVCIHGGGLSNRYFDIPGASLLEPANAAGFDVFSVDRPDHGASPPLPKGATLIDRNALLLCKAVDELLNLSVSGRREVVLVGHSIGAAIAICMAAQTPPWLAGVALSGIGFIAPPSLPPIRILKWLSWFRRKLATPKSAIFGKLFGPEGSYDPDLANQLWDLASSPGVLQEMFEIYGWWPAHCAAMAAAVRVPVDCALAEFDALWVTNADTTSAFGKLFVNSPRVVSDVFAGAGHCIDHHRLGPVFHQRQLDFARSCI